MPVSSLHIAVFCKALIPGEVKTRLIPAYGVDGATDIYTQLVERTLRTVNQAKTALSASASLWVAGDVEHPSVRGWSDQFELPVHSQCAGDLGEKMLHCLRTLVAAHTHVLLIGTDCPALHVDHLRAASNAISETCPWVFTPAEDGGYVLVGSRTPVAVPFVGISWSTSSVMAQTRAVLKANTIKWAETAPLWDVDETADVERALAEGLIVRG